jgi:hypothetical protein
VLTKDLLRVSRAGGGYHPQFVDADAESLAARVVGVYQGHVGETRADLRAALDDLEGEAGDFKLVRGFASLCDREATFETRSPVPPDRVRRAVFAAAEAVGVVTPAERRTALDRAADRLGSDRETVAEALYADREPRQVLARFEPRWDPPQLVEQYNLSLAQTALFDATEVRVRSGDPRAVVSAVKRLGLLYEVRRVDASGDAEGDAVRDGPAADPADGADPGSETDLSAPATREVVVTGPDALFRRTRRYGTAFARLLRSVAATPDWRLTATIDDRGTERELTLGGEDLGVPGVEPVAEPSYDSAVEADFAARFESLDLGWDLVREPEPLATGHRVMIPDFAFDWSQPAFRVYFEIMGFWTPEYVEKKLAQLDGLEDVEMLVAVDESLGVGSDVEARDARAITYSGTVRVKDVVDVLREYESDLVAAAAAGLPPELVPAADVVPLAEVAATHGVDEAALAETSFPEHERVGRTLVRPSVLAALREDLEPGMRYEAAAERLEAAGLREASAALSRLGYRVAWTGLGSGELREA